MKHRYVGAYRDTTGQVPDACTDMDIAATAFYAQNENRVNALNVHREIAFAVSSRYWPAVISTIPA